MMEHFAAENRLLRDIKRETAAVVSIGCQTEVVGGYFKFTISPVRISAAAAATRRGVRRFRRPSWTRISNQILDDIYSLLEGYGTNIVIFAPDPSACS